MPLRPITLSPQSTQIPPAVEKLLQEADEHCHKFFERGLGRRYPRYLPSHAEKVYTAIHALRESNHLRGHSFCEWGSGLGVATCLASLIGFDAVGIEIEPGLVELSIQLARELNLSADFLCTSYLPEGYDEAEGIGGKDLITPEARTSHSRNIDTSPIYDGLDPGEVDLFFVYPWPGQEEFMMDLFGELATEDSVLLIHHADSSTTAYRQEPD